MDRAPDSKSGCWGFESLLACHFFCSFGYGFLMDKIKLIFAKVKQFLKEAKIELRKVTWPTPKQTLASTSVVIIVVVIISLFLGVVDFGLSKIIRLALG
jgi:preprotein translocase subunit SecE